MIPNVNVSVFLKNVQKIIYGTRKNVCASVKNRRVKTTKSGLNFNANASPVKNKTAPMANNGTLKFVAAIAQKNNVLYSIYGILENVSVDAYNKNVFLAIYGTGPNADA